MGHEAGDKALILLSCIFRRKTRQTDTIARRGGDEFAILAEGIAQNELVSKFGQRICEALRVTYALNNIMVSISGSVGFAGLTSIARRSSVAWGRLGSPGLAGVGGPGGAVVQIRSFWVGRQCLVRQGARCGGAVVMGWILSGRPRWLWLGRRSLLQTCQC